MRRVLFLSLAFACIAAAFDPARIHADYQAGEFEKVIRALEAFRESGRRCRKADSVFLEKHLAVVYAADPKTRERGRYHMLRMLALEPEADLLDMFVGEEVDGIFGKVQKESRVRRMAQAKARTAKAPQPAKGDAPRTAAVARSGAGPVPKPPLPGPRPAVPAARVPRPAFPEPGPAPRLKPWNLEDAPASTRGGRKPVGNPRRGAMPAEALLAWDFDRTASSASGPAMGVLPADAGATPLGRAASPRAKPAALNLQSERLPPVEPPMTGNPEDTGSPEDGPKPRWKEKGFWVGGTAVAAVLGLTAYYVGSQEWSGSESRSRTYGVAAKPNGN